jgi:hypothetical protein
MSHEVWVIVVGNYTDQREGAFPGDTASVAYKGQAYRRLAVQGVPYLAS